MATEREAAMLTRIFAAARTNGVNNKTALTQIIAALKREGFTVDELDRPFTRIHEREKPLPGKGKN